MARSSDGHLAGRPSGRALHQPEECAISPFPHHKGRYQVITRHPLDLEMIKPLSVIFEAKPVRRVGPLFAIREAVGQLFQYRRFVGPRQARLCILLDSALDTLLVDYVENDLGLMVAW